MHVFLNDITGVQESGCSQLMAALDVEDSVTPQRFFFLLYGMFLDELQKSKGWLM